MHEKSFAGRWEFREAGHQEWSPARVPGGVHTDLLSAGKIPDPFVADNETRVQWVAQTDWEYRYRFIVSSELMQEEHVLLVCDGLDTLANVTLNGTPIGWTENMFRQYRWEVKSLLKAEENELFIHFE